MGVSKGASILLLIIFVNIFHETEGQDKFFTDFLKCFNIEDLFFITTDELDQDLANTKTNNSTTALIRYTTNKDEEEVADHLQKLHLSGDLKVAVFIDHGHHKLLDLLSNGRQLFNNGLTGLISELDETTGLSLTLRLDTRLYTYTSKGNKISLKEVYAVNGKKKVQTVGTWSWNTGLILPVTSMWERRSNLEGMSIRVATMSVQNLHEIHYDKSGDSVIGGSGFFLEPLNILAKELNFTWKLKPSNDGQWGAMDNGTWNGLISMLINEQTDIAAAALTVTKGRMNVVAFSRAIAHEVITLISAPNVEREANPHIYIEIFPHTVWYVICGLVLSISTCFAITNYSGKNNMHDKFDSEKFTIMNGLGLSLTFFRQIYYDVNINCKSTRILFILSAVSTYLLYIHYTAYLTAASTYVKKTPIASFRDVLNGGYQVVVWENSVFHDLLRDAKSGTAMNEVYQKTMKNRNGAFHHSYTDLPKILASQENLIYNGDFFTKSQYQDLMFLRIQGLLFLNCYKTISYFCVLFIYVGNSKNKFPVQTNLVFRKK